MTGPERDEFDRMIEQEIAGTVPSQGVVEEVNPWREPVGRIAWGLALTGITLNFLYLQYLLPRRGRCAAISGLSRAAPQRRGLPAGMAAVRCVAGMGGCISGAVGHALAANR